MIRPHQRIARHEPTRFCDADDRISARWHDIAPRQLENRHDRQEQTEADQGSVRFVPPVHRKDRNSSRQQRAARSQNPPVALQKPPPPWQKQIESEIQPSTIAASLWRAEHPAHPDAIRRGLRQTGWTSGHCSAQTHSLHPTPDWQTNAKTDRASVRADQENQPPQCLQLIR